jgi:hypothetical protein
MFYPFHSALNHVVTFGGKVMFKSCKTVVLYCSLGLMAVVASSVAVSPFKDMHRRLAQLTRNGSVVGAGYGFSVETRTR